MIGSLPFGSCAKEPVIKQIIKKSLVHLITIESDYICWCNYLFMLILSIAQEILVYTDTSSSLLRVCFLFL